MSGPYEVGLDQSVKKPRYYLTGNLTIPISGDIPLVEGLRELGMTSTDISAHLNSQLPLPSSTSSARPKDLLGTVINGRGSRQIDDQENGCQLKQVDAAEGEVPGPEDLGNGGDHEDVDPFRENHPDPQQELSEAEVQAFDVLDLKWKELLKTRPTVEVTNLTQSMPLKSRSPKDVLETLAQMMVRFQTLRVPISRVHTDRAKEFCSQQFRKFLLSKNILQTTTAGDEPATNGRCEQELGVVRGIARAALRACGGPSNHWPLAIRYASETIQVVEEEVAKEMETEVLQTKTISMQEVRDNYLDWVKPFAEEYSNLTQTVITPLDQQQLAEVMKNAVKIERVPGKLVATLKPPAKQRGRIVACGNFMSEVNGETSASGLDCIALRAVLRKAADQNWSVSSLDVRRAFLNAPRLEQPGHVTLVDPPALLQKMGITRPHEVWQIRGALYGLCESPRDWSVHRDKTLRSLRWQCGDTYHTFKESGERNLWKICDESTASTLGYLCVYVDDLLLTGPETVLTPALEKLQATWECSQPEWVNEDQSMRFCGFEIQQLQGGGLKLWQPSYIQDLIEKHEITGEESTPCPKVVHGDTEVVQPQVLHQAQMFTGELQWIQSRTRPDLAYVCGLMSRLQHRRPSYVIEIALHTLRYLKKTWNFALNYRPCKVLDWGDENQLQCPRAMNQLEVYADSSFSLEHEEDRSVQGIVIEQAGAAIQWSSSRQPFVAASTAESELISYAEAHQQALSVGALLQILEYDVSYVLYGDNRSALSLATSESGPWRTRHLRLRASRLRDDLRTDNPDRVVQWSARHLPGELLVADGLTKALTGPIFLRFISRLGLELSSTETSTSSSSMKKAAVAEESGWRTKAKLILQIGALLRGVKNTFLVKLANILLAVGGWCLKNHESTEHDEAEETEMAVEQPRVAALRGGGFQLPVRPTQDGDGSLAAARGRAVMEGASSTMRSSGGVPGWWDLPEIQKVHKGKDKWMMSGRWLIRAHGEPRRRSFHPVHRSCPVDLQRIKHQRATLVHEITDDVIGNRKLREDSWTSNHAWSMDYRWRGFTIFELNDEESFGGSAQPSYASGLDGHSRTVASSMPIPEGHFRTDDGVDPYPDGHSRYEVRGGSNPDGHSRDGAGYDRRSSRSSSTPLYHGDGSTSTAPMAQSSLMVQSPLVQLNIQVMGSDVTIRQQSPSSKNDEDSEYEVIDP